MKQLTVMFLVRDDEVLLAMKKRGFGQGRWNGVGGKVESGESFKEAAARECSEEIEVIPKTYDQVAEIIFDEAHQGVREKLQVQIFVCSDWYGTPKETEEMAPKWFKKNDLPFADMWADDEYWLPQVLAGKKLICQFKLGNKDEIIEKKVKEIKGF